MAEPNPKLVLKGVIQVNDGPGWGVSSKGGKHDSKQIFTPILDAIQSIGKEYPTHSIGLIYGANSVQTEKIFTEYGFSKEKTPSKMMNKTTTTPLDHTIMSKINSLTPLGILNHISGNGQAEVLSNPDVQKMVSDTKVKFIIIPFDTMTHDVATDGVYGHKDDCLAFAKMFLNSPNTIIVGWRNMKSKLAKLNSNMELQAIDADMFNLHFALGGGEAGNLDATAKEYIDFLISKWDQPSQKFIESKIVPGGKKVDDDTGKTKLGTGIDDADAEKKPAGVTEAKIVALKKRLAETNSKLQATATAATPATAPVATATAPTATATPVATPAATPAAPEIAAATPAATSVAAETVATPSTPVAAETVATASADRAAAYGIAEEIFNVFFSGGEDKSKQTKDFLTEKVTALQGLTIFSNESSKAHLDEIAKRLETLALATSADTSIVGIKPIKPMIKPVVTPVPKKYVFAFDIDDTLVRSGTLVKTTGRSIPFNTTTHATDYDKMIKLMNDMIVAKHYVWIVTANSNISKADFDTKYLKGDTGIKSSENYYFMNPKTVTTDLKAQFVSDTISPYLTDTKTPLDLSFSHPTGSDFQSKWLKPYAMIAKWLQLTNPNMNDVQMYLFDDSDGYETTCNNVKENKIEFVKISSGPSPSPSPPSPGFTSDVLAKATEKFNAIPKTTTTPVTSGGNNLNVMTFNTWYEAFNPSKYNRTKYCGDDTANKCTDTIMKTIVDRMKEGGQQVIFLQEFTSRFDDFFTKAGVTINKPDRFASKINVQTTDDTGAKVDTGIPQLRHFTMTVDGKKFYVYTATIGSETITTIYSSDLCDNSADAFFIGNTATVRESTKDNAPYFWKDKTDKADADSWIFGGARPYIVLEFKDKKLVLINLHSQHDEPFKSKEGFTDDKTTFINKFKSGTGNPNSVQTYAFSVLGNMLRDNRIPNLDDYGIIIGGDFNAEPERTLNLLNLSLGTTTKKFTDGGIDRKKVGYTCCTTTDTQNFNKSGDQIYSRGLEIVKDSYKVHEVTTLEKGTGKKFQNYFSDHLPVYATITLPPIASAGP